MRKNPQDRPYCKEGEILLQLRKIPYGTLVKIMWLDASTVKGANIEKLPLQNYYVETRRITVGEYVALQRGQAQKAWHVVLMIDNTESAGAVIRSIPICLIYQVIPSAKTTESTEVSVVDKKRLQIVNREKQEIRLRDGSVKVLD